MGDGEVAGLVQPEVVEALLGVLADLQAGGPQQPDGPLHGHPGHVRAHGPRLVVLDDHLVYVVELLLVLLHHGVVAALTVEDDGVEGEVGGVLHLVPGEVAHGGGQVATLAIPGVGVVPTGPETKFLS